MHRAEHDRQAEQQWQQRQPGDRHMHGEDEAHRLAKIVVDPPAEPDGLDDRAEIVVEQHDRGGLARDVGAAPAHGDADMRGLERRRVVDAVPVMATISPFALSAVTIRSFCSGMMRANTVAVRTRSASSAFVQCLQILAGDDIVGVEARLAGDRRWPSPDSRR